MESPFPPTYPELGKLARELFKKNYHPGIWQLDCKTKTGAGNVELISSGFANQDLSKVVGLLQSNYKMDDYGLVIKDRWNTENILWGEIVQRDKLAEGLMLGVEMQLQPDSGDKEGKLKLGYAQDQFNFLADINLDALLNASIVGRYNEFLGGFGVGVDASGGELASWKVALGWTNETATLHGELKDGKDWLATLFYKINEKIDLGVEFLKGAPPPPAEGEQPPEEGQESGGEMTLGVGAIYHLEGDALIRGKINTNVDIGLGYEQKLGEGITFSISCQLEGKKITDGNHKFGIGFALEC